MTQRHANRTYTNRRYLDAIQDHVVIYDGAMGTSIQRYNLTADDFGGEQYNGCNDYLVITRPDVIAAIHESFLRVGAEVVETCTFRSNPLTLREYGLQDKTYDQLRGGAVGARRVRQDRSRDRHPAHGGGQHRAVGKLPSGTDPDLSNITFDELADVFYAQAKGLVEGGCDVLLIGADFRTSSKSRRRSTASTACSKIWASASRCRCR